MKNSITIFGLCLALVILALPARAQENEPAPLPDDWDRISKAVDLSLDQIQAVRTELDARKAALADWEKAHAVEFEALKKEMKTAQETQNADALRALEEKAKPFMAERNTIKTNSEARLNAVLRPEQKATWAAVGRYEKDFRAIQQLPDITDTQKTQLAAGFKDVTTALGRWDTEKGAQLESLLARGEANSKARHDAEVNGAGAADQMAALRKEHEEIGSATAALRAEREKLADEGAAKLFTLLTPDQLATVKLNALLGDLENKLNKLNLTPDQMAAVKALCETETKAMTGTGARDFSKARERLQRAIIAHVLTAEQKELAQGKKPADPLKSAPVVPTAPTPAPAAPK